MANTTYKSTALKLVYDFGMSGDKKIVKSKLISGINPAATDDQLLNFANAMFRVQVKSGEIQKISTATITN